MSNNRYQAVLFDLDGTVIDSRPQIHQCVNLALEEMGHPILSDEQVRVFLGPPLMDSFQNVIGYSYEDAEKATAIYRKYYNAGIVLESKEYEGIREVLKAVRDVGMKISLATSKPEEMAVRILDHWGLSDAFDVITGAGMADNVRHSKAEVVEEALRRLGFTPETYDQVVMVGDRKYDMIGGKAFGLDCLGVYYGYADPGELEEAGADMVVNTMEELKEVLLKGRVKE